MGTLLEHRKVIQVLAIIFRGDLLITALFYISLFLHFKTKLQDLSKF